jgi:hypothetical protein
MGGPGGAADAASEVRWGRKVGDGGTHSWGRCDPGGLRGIAHWHAGPSRRRGRRASVQLASSVTVAVAMVGLAALHSLTAAKVGMERQGQLAMELTNTGCVKRGKRRLKSRFNYLPAGQTICCIGTLRCVLSLDLKFRPVTLKRILLFKNIK